MRNRNKIAGAIALVGVSSLVLTGCAGAAGGGSGDICDEITVLTNRTDIVDTVFANEYAPEFADANGGTKVKFEAITDYEGELPIRMNTAEYGDVLLIPNSVKPEQYADFFEPLGSVDDMSSTYRFVQEKAFDGQVYGIAQTGNAAGYVLNKRVWEEAGITTPPATPEEFVAAMKTIKEKTGAIPVYTNYKDGWPITAFESFRGYVDGPAASNNLASDTSPWADGKEHYIADSLLFDLVANGLTEADPTTTAWEPSKALIGSGEVATMFLGSWAVTQMKDAAVAAGFSAEDISFWPLPVQKDGNFQSVIGGDYKVAINKNSKCKGSARAWLDYFVGDSGYAFSQGGIAPRQDGPTPDTLGEFDKLGVVYIELDPAPAGQEGKLSAIETASELSLYAPDYRQKLVDIARGAADGDKASYFEELNKKWANGVSNAG
jgi:raffinose/stachyose/melibiose transport system substrate-binding protein